MLVDREGRLFTYRTEIIRFLDNIESELKVYAAIMYLLGHVLHDPMARKARAKEDRGPHEPCIIGHMREYQKACFNTFPHPKFYLIFCRNHS